MGKLLAGLLAASVTIAAAPPAKPETAQPWWKTDLLYEIYPRSFADSNGDGVGDLDGIARHLDYLKWLGVGTIWIAPVYPSPQVDFGYDISDYEAIDPQYGTMADFTRLQQAAGKRGIHILMDMVLNHTSDKHAWFVDSASSRTSRHADWYVWNDGVPAATLRLSSIQKGNIHDGMAPPNNWTSVFGGSAWEWVPARKQFYYHKFYIQQPDLNWRNPAVETAMFDVMRFWLDRGVAGFRLDAIPTMFEDKRLRDEPEQGGTDPFGLPALDHVYTEDQAEAHPVMRRLRAMVDSYPGDRVLIGETYVRDTAALSRWYGGARHDELHLSMDMLPAFGDGARYTPAWFRPVLAASQTDLDGNQPLLVFDNHDQHRSIDRFGDGTHDVAIAKGIATILLASRATALTYYGAPLGMRTRTPVRREDVRDPVGIAGWPREKGRDGQRTPMQWTPGAQAGFTTGPTTWLPIDPAQVTINVETARADPESLLNWYHRLIALRGSVVALRDGTMTMIDTRNPDVLAWTRTAADGGRVAVAINMTANAKSLALPAAAGRTLAANGGASAAGSAVTLPAFATWIGEMR